MSNKATAGNGTRCQRNVMTKKLERRFFIGRDCDDAVWGLDAMLASWAKGVPLKHGEIECAKIAIGDKYVCEARLLIVYELVQVEAEARDDEEKADNQ